MARANKPKIAKM